MLGALLMQGCGKTRNVIDAVPNGMGGSDSGGAGRDGWADGGADVEAGRGGSGAEAGHAAGTGQGGGVPTWDPLECHATPVLEPSDPTAREQWTLAREFCSALREQGCLQSGAVLSVAGCSGDQAVEACIAEVLWAHSEQVPVECEDQWRADLACAAKSNFAPPGCEGANTFDVGYGAPNSCTSEKAAIVECVAKQTAEVSVVGSYTECSYSSGSSCFVTCPVGPHKVELHCSGAEGLPKQCGCTINGHIAPPLNPIFVSDCAAAATQAADGLCTGQLDCCFTYLDRNGPTCCCSEPTTYGYDSCEAMMAVANGQRVDICPALLPAESGEGCWPPGHCPP